MSPPAEQTPEPTDALAQAFRRERAAGLRLALLARVLALVALASWLITRVGVAASAYYLTLLAVFLLIGVAQWLVGRRVDRLGNAALAILVLAEMALIAWLIVQPSVGDQEAWPAAMQLRLGNSVVFFVFVAFAALGYAPRLALWTGAAAVLAWLGGVAWIISQPGTYTITDLQRLHGLDRAALRDLLLDPHYVSSVILVQEVLSILIVAGIVALAVARARDLALREARAAGERANLARYFSPNLVEVLAGDRVSLSEVRAQEAAVLFIDIVGFTRMAEAMSPTEVIALLREFHGRVAAAVFAHSGTLNKYVGDAVMATFGTPRRGRHDASDALGACLAIVATLEAWNRTLAQRGSAPVQAGIGAHWGPVVLGDIGDARCVEFAVLGDTVNIASRLERATRELEAAMVVSEALIGRAAEEGAEISNDLAPAPAPLAVRNRAEPVAVRILRR